MKEINLQVREDHVQSLASVAKPIAAIEELIWNGLDADATSVRVEVDRNALGGIEEVRVIDNGHGIDFNTATPAFESLGGSWKSGGSRSRDQKRLLHGQKGRGRFRAFALGTEVQWTTNYRQDGAMRSYSITGKRTNLCKFAMDDEPRPSEAKDTGTTVFARKQDEPYSLPDTGEATIYLAERFAPYLKQYPGVTIVYEGIPVDYSGAIVRERNMILSPRTEDGRQLEASLSIIEWSFDTRRRLLLCDENGFALGDSPAGIQAPGYSFTGYLRTRLVRELFEANALELGELHPDLEVLVRASREALKSHFRQREAETSVDVIEKWKRNEIYPYSGEPLGVIDEAQRQVFDVCAVKISDYLPDFEKANVKSQRFQLQLLRQALEGSPDAIMEIISSVLDLPEAKQDELAELLQKTSLSAMINAAKIVTDRLEFLRGLEVLLFEKESRASLLERSQQHKILAEHTWIFGEQYNLAVSDQSLTEVLKQHQHLIGGDPTEDESSVTRTDGSAGIVDLMLSRRIPQPKPDQREHLVIELKRPSQSIDYKAAHQLMTYAQAVANDERFAATNTSWVFVAVSNRIADDCLALANQANRPAGLYFENAQPDIRVWLKTWAQIVEECKGRLEFFRKQLEYEANRDSAVAYLRRQHEQHLPQHLRRDGTKVDVVPPAEMQFQAEHRN